MRSFIITTIFIILGTVSLSATSYYIAANGNDANNGTTITTPWKSIAKVNANMNLFHAGDAVYFRRGDIFREKLILGNGTAGNATTRLTFGAYSTGSNPIISGADVVTGWTAQTVNGLSMYTATFAQTPKHLFVNGTQM